MKWHLWRTIETCVISRTSKSADQNWSKAGESWIRINHRLLKSLSTHQNTWQAGNTETSQSIILERALLCWRRRERGSRTASSAFILFQWKQAVIKIPCEPYRSSSLVFVYSHFCMGRPAEVIELLFWLLWDQFIWPLLEFLLIELNY